MKQILGCRRRCRADAAISNGFTANAFKSDLPVQQQAAMQNRRSAAPRCSR